MDYIDNGAIFSRTKVVFENYANDIANILRSKEVEMIEKSWYHDNIDYFIWRSCGDEKNCAIANINIAYFRGLGGYHCYADFIINIFYPCYSKKTPLEAVIIKNAKNKIGKKYPLANVHFSVSSDTPKILILKPAEEVAEQLYASLKSYNKITSPKIISKIKKADERMSKLFEKVANVITESFFFQ